MSVTGVIINSGQYQLLLCPMIIGFQYFNHKHHWCRSSLVKQVIRLSFIGCNIYILRAYQALPFPQFSWCTGLFHQQSKATYEHDHTTPEVLKLETQICIETCSYAQHSILLCKGTGLSKYGPSSFIRIRQGCCMGHQYLYIYILLNLS